MRLEAKTYIIFDIESIIVNEGERALQKYDKDFEKHGLSGYYFYESFVKTLKKYADDCEFVFINDTGENFDWLWSKLGLSITESIAVTKENKEKAIKDFVKEKAHDTFIILYYNPSKKLELWANSNIRSFLIPTTQVKLFTGTAAERLSFAVENRSLKIFSKTINDESYEIYDMYSKYSGTEGTLLSFTRKGLFIVVRFSPDFNEEPAIWAIGNKPSDLFTVNLPRNYRRLKSHIANYSFNVPSFKDFSEKCFNLLDMDPFNGFLELYDNYEKISNFVNPISDFYSDLAVEIIPEKSFNEILDSY